MLKKINKKKINNKIIILAAIFVIIALQFFYAKSVYAGTGNIVVDLIGSAIGGVLNIASAPIFMLLGTIVVGVSWLVGQISTLLVYLLFYVASYNSFIKEGIVGYGWVIVRDICNMFFILILLIIAFATILRIENYNVKKLLPKLLIMAVLINFSKTICGLAIDFSQVIMLTFVNGLNAGDSFFGHGALVNALGLNKLLSMKTAVIDTLTSAFATSANPMSVFGSLLFGLILLIIACIVVGIYTIVLMFRIVMLWILIILSPLAFLAMAIPAGAKYASQWSSEFTKYLIVGPAMAFFLWLALLLSQASFTTNFNLSQSIGAANTGFDSQILTEMGNPQNLANFAVVIVFLLAGLMVAQQMGVAGGGMAGNAVAKIKATGIGAAKWTGRTAAYLPKEYAKRAGYGAADLALEGLKRAPIIGGIAIKKQGELQMKRKYAEEKDTRYIKYLSEQDLDRVMRNYTGEGRTRAGRALSFATRGQEASRQGYERALVEKAQRGEDWGHGDERRRRKTQAMIAIARLGDHTVTAEGEDSFRDAELGKLFHELRNKNIGDIDDNLMRDYYGTVRGGRYINEDQRLDAQGNPVFVDAQGNNAFVDANGNPALRSEYYRTNDVFDRTQLDANGNPVQIASAGPGMRNYTAERLRENQLRSLHHSQLTPEVLDAVWGDGVNAPFKALAQMRDRDSRQVKAAVDRFMRHRIAMGDVPGNERFVNTADPNRPMKTLAQVMSNTDYTPDTGSPLGRSRNVTGKLKSPQVASGITGLDKIDKGRLALNFSDIGLDNLDALYVEGKDKTEIASRIRQSLSQVDENLAKTVEDQINSVSYLVLHNKEKNMSGKERRATHAHEILHGRLSSNFHDDELKSVWNSSMSETDREKARQKVKKVYGNNNMSEDAVMHEYFTEGLTNKTRWAVKDPEKKITLDSKAEESLENLLKSKGSNIQAFTSNITETRPTKDDVKQTMAGAVNSKLQESMENLANAIENMGDGLDSINKVGGSLGDLEKSIYMNNINLEKNAEAFKDNSSRLNDLTNKLS